MIEDALWIVLGASWLYWVAVWWSVGAFFRRARPQRSPALQSRAAEAVSAKSAFTPAVSILKPVKGLDAEAYENFASFCRQEYPRFEILFGVAQAADPAVAVVRRLQRDFPSVAIRLVVVPEAGLNPKSSILRGLSCQARFGVLAISDSDIRVAPDYLRHVVAPLEDPHHGLVTCPYRSVAAATLPARLEALYLDTNFVPSAIAAGTGLKRCFGLGATLVLRREDLERFGGYAAVSDYLSDDYQVAIRVAAQGLKVVLSDHVVENVLGATALGDQFDRETRWARSIRVLHPRAYAGQVLTFSTPLAVALVALSGASAAALGALAGSLVLRWLLAASISGYLGHSRRWHNLLWLPVRDILTCLIWCRGGVGRRVTWRGQTYRVHADNRLEAAPHECGPLLSRAVRLLDRRLRHRQGIYEFSNHDDCLLRVSITQADRDLCLSDGTQVRRGEPVGELHFWNERMPRMATTGPDVLWARRFRRQLDRSLRELVQHVQTDGRFDGIQAIRAELPVGSRHGAHSLERMRQYFGAEFVEPDRAARWSDRIHGLGQALLLWALMRTFNPASLRHGLFSKRRRQVWLSRAALATRFASPTACAVLPSETGGNLLHEQTERESAFYATP